jgi:hypothetical protein
VDPCAGILLHAKVGQYVLAGAMIAEPFSNKQGRVVWQDAALRIDECIQYSDEAVMVPPIVSHRVTTEMGVEAFSYHACARLLTTVTKHGALQIVTPCALSAAA